MHSIIKTDCTKLISKINTAKLKNKKVLITGATGLIGVYLVAFFKLLKKKHNIDLWCWFKNDVDANFTSLFEGLQIVRSDITDKDSYNNLPKFDYIIHCAGYGQPMKFLEDKIKTININTNTTIDLLNLLKKTGTFLFISSSEIYSGLESTNITEEQVGSTDVNHPRACYIQGKKTGETICHTFIEKGYNVRIARVSTVYGPGVKKHDKRVSSNIIDKGLTEKEIVLMDSGSAKRVFCYILDATEMLVNILLHSKQITYNVAGIDNLSIFELATNIGRILNKTVKIPKTNTSLQGNPKTVSVSIARYLNEFKKTKFTNFKHGLKQTIKWHKAIK